MKHKEAEHILPEFNLGRVVGRRIASQRGRRAVVLCVVDAADFDGSLPRAAMRGIFPAQQKEVGWPLLPDNPLGTYYSKFFPGLIRVTTAMKLTCLIAPMPVQASNSRSWHDSKDDNNSCLVLAANKVDLIPKQVTKLRLEV